MPRACTAVTDSSRKMAAVTVEMTGMLSVMVDDAHSGRCGIETLIRKCPPTPATTANRVIQPHADQSGHERSWRNTAAAGQATSDATIAVIVEYLSAPMRPRAMREAMK